MNKKRGEVRKLRLSDVRELAAIEKELYPDDFINGAFFMACYMLWPNQNYGYFQDGKLKAYLIAVWSWNQWNILDIAVLPGYERYLRGILMEACLNVKLNQRVTCSCRPGASLHFGKYFARKHREFGLDFLEEKEGDTIAGETMRDFTYVKTKETQASRRIKRRPSSSA